MSCASILILELLRQNQNPAERPPAAINRSRIIQDISILISCCDSLTESGQSNYQICKQAQSIFSRSLDSILNHPEPGHVHKSKSGQHMVPTHENDQGQYDQENPVSSDVPSAIVQDSEWMSCLDSLGLQGDPWLDTIVPTLEDSMGHPA